MPGYTTPDNLPYPNDYQEDADVPVNMQSLANATQVALDKKMSDQATLIAGQGLTGGGAVELNPTLNVGQGTGISVGADTVALDKAYTDGLYSSVNHNHNGVYSPVSHTHDSVNYAISAGNADTVDGQHAAAFASAGHSHGGNTGKGIWAGIGGVNTLQANESLQFVITHNWNYSPAYMWIAVTGDDGVTSIVAAIVEWNANTITVTARNIGSAAESFQIQIFGI